HWTVPVHRLAEQALEYRRVLSGAAKGVTSAFDLNQLFHHSATIDQRHGPSERTVVLPIGIDAQQRMNGAQQIVYTNRIARWRRSLRVCRPDHSPRLYTATGNNHALRHRPMIAARLGVDSRCSPHLAH